MLDLNDLNPQQIEIVHPRNESGSHPVGPHHRVPPHALTCDLHLSGEIMSTAEI